MGFETAFQDKFDKSVDRALSTGVRGAFVEGCTYGVASALIYLAEALLFYVGAVLIANGTYTYLRMIQVLNLVVFSVSIGSQLMAFSKFLFGSPFVCVLIGFFASFSCCKSRPGDARSSSTSQTF